MEVRRVVKAERAMSGSAVVFWCLLFTSGLRCAVFGSGHLGTALSNDPAGSWWVE